MEGLAKDYYRSWTAILEKGEKKKKQHRILINKILYNSFFMQERRAHWPTLS